MGRLSERERETSMKRYCLLGAMMAGLGLTAAAEPGKLAGMPFIAATSKETRNLMGQLKANSVVNVSYHTQKNGSDIKDCYFLNPLKISSHGYDFTIEHAQYDPMTDTFVGDGALSGGKLPKRLLVKGVRFNQAGILSVQRLISRGWSTANHPWALAQGNLSPVGLSWNAKSQDINLDGLFLQGKFHADLEAEVDDGHILGVTLRKPTTVLHQGRVAFIKAVHLVKDNLYVDGYTPAPNGKPWHFKKCRVNKDGSLAVEFPLSWDVTQLIPVANLNQMPSPPMASAGGAPPTRPGMWGEMKEDLFRPSPALADAIAQGYQVVPIEGAPNLQMVITQTSNGGKNVDGFIPLMDWVGQAQVYGATFNGKTANVDKATMNWLKKEVRPPAAGFGVCTLQDPIHLNKVNGRLASGLAGNPNFRGMGVNLLTWEVDAKEFRFEAGTFHSVSGKLNPTGSAAPWSLTMTTTGDGINFASAPPVPANLPMAGPNDPINVSYQGGAEFDIVFMEGGKWGFEFRTALPQLDIGGPEWMRTGMFKAPKGIKWPTIFTKVYSNGFVYFNFVGTGLSVPINDGLVLASPSILFNFVPEQALFYLLLQAQVNIADVDPNIFTVKGRLFVEGGGMKRSGAGEAELTGYLLNIQMNEFDVGFGVNTHEDGTLEEKFAVTATVFQILGFSVDVSGEADINPPAGQWCVGLSAWVHIIFVDVGLTFYGYPDGHVSFAFGGHEFHVATSDGNNPQYQGLFTLLGVDWYGTETVDQSKGNVTATGKSTWTGPLGAMTGKVKLNTATVNEEGVASCDMSYTSLDLKIPYNETFLTASGTNLPIQLDVASSCLRSTIKAIDVDVEGFKGKVDVEVRVDVTGTCTVSFDFPANAGGSYTVQFDLTGKGDSSTAQSREEQLDGKGTSGRRS
jgi:hypothetical protein